MVGNKQQNSLWEKCLSPESNYYYLFVCLFYILLGLLQMIFAIKYRKMKSYFANFVSEQYII